MNEAKPNRAARRRQPLEAVPGPIAHLDDAQAFGLNAAQENLNRALAAVEQAKAIHLKVMTSLGLDSSKNYELDGQNNVYLRV